MAQALTDILDAIPCRPLGLKEITWYGLIILFTIPQTVIILQLTWRSIGMVVSVKKTMPWALLIGIINALGRSIIPVPVNVLIIAASILGVTIIAVRVGPCRASTATIFAEIIVIGGSILFIEPIFVIGGAKIQYFFLNNLLGFMLGSIAETVLPLIVLCFLIRRNVVIFTQGRDIRVK